MMASPSQKRIVLAWLAKNFVGAIESKPNGGPLVERFQKAVDGSAVGEPWCVGFVQYCANAVDDLSTLLNGGGFSHGLFKTEWTIDLYAKSEHKFKDAAVGRIAVWRHTINTNRGHCGIVTDVIGDDVHTVEGNTSSSAGNQRDGDGVWQKTRHAGNIEGFELLGYLSPWE